MSLLLFQKTFCNVSLGPVPQRLVLFSGFIDILGEKARSVDLGILGICQGKILIY